MLGGRNIARWMVKSHEYMIVPHSSEYKYGIPAVLLAREAPETFQWLSFYHDELLDTRIQNGKFLIKKHSRFIDWTMLEHIHILLIKCYGRSRREVCLRL